MTIKTKRLLSVTYKFLQFSVIVKVIHEFLACYSGVMEDFGPL